MQTTSPQFDALANSDVRPLSWSFNASFDKRIDNSITFFTLDTSTLDGADLLAPGGSNVLAEWDKYVSRSYADRVMQIEWVREEEVPYSVNLAMADILLRNDDRFFNYGLAPKIASLADSLTSINVDDWFVYGNPTFGVNGVTIPTFATASYNGLSSQYSYVLKDSGFTVELVDAGNQSLPSLQVLIQLYTINNQNSAVFIVENNVLIARRLVNNVSTNIHSAAYNATDHRWLRIREDSDIIYFDTSADGLTWANFTTETVANMGLVFDLSNVVIDLLAGTFADEGVASAITYKNVNIDGNNERIAPFSSPIAQYNLPRRPIRILSGFKGLNIPQFVGLTDKAPETDYLAKTASLHAEDFLSFIFNRPLDQTTIQINKTTGEVLDYLFQLVGLSPTQYVLDQSFNTIKFVYFEKGTKLGNAIRDLMQAELGSLYMDEFGIIRFINRARQNSTPVHTFNKDNIIDYKLSDDDDIINVVEVKSAVREVQPTQVIFSSSAPIELTTGNTDVFFNFEDPVTTLEVIEFYIANSQEDGQGSDVTADVAVSATALFSEAVKVTFNNTSGNTAWIQDITLYGTPAKVIRNIYVRYEDQSSIERFEEKTIDLQNNFIQDDDGAISLALSLLNYYKSYNNTIELTVKGTPALQLGDNILVQVDNLDQVFSITKITNTLEQGRFRQILKAKVYDIPKFFTLDESELNGEDALSP